ncbi:MAG: NAD(P)-binding domain-containing protein [Thaumarchaeota archaeon]|nr:NAD(P)-binding domain-containing protein [Nitrososphaerota archaeon]
MKIGLLGGTGKFGMGLAVRLAPFHTIIIGSRKVEKAKSSAQAYLKVCRQNNPNFSGSIIGDSNLSAARSSNVIIICLKLEPALELAAKLRDLREDQIVVSPIVDIHEEVPRRKASSTNLEQNNVGSVAEAYLKHIMSCAEAVAGELGRREQVISALHTLPAERLSDLSQAIDADVLVCGDDVLNVKIVTELIGRIPEIRAHYAGPLRLSSHVEGIAIAISSLSRYSKIHQPTIKVV